MARTPPLDERFRASLRALGLHGTGARVLAAVSGGCDSVVLLHLLRFHASDAGIDLHAAHFDHAMRPGSDADARWVAGLCRAWGVPLTVERAETAPRTEAEARDARYAFLRRVMRERGMTHLATAHHADDQAETVLFRVLRGTGIAGLAGIPAADGTGLVRPLLPFWRAELARWARCHRLRWREDPTNDETAAARNYLRREVIPALERRVAPGARRSLVRLAEAARAEEAAWERAVDGAERRLVRREKGAVVLVRTALGGYDSAVAARLVRRLLRELGAVPDRAGTRRALQFINGAPSGRQLRVSGGVRLRTEFDTVRMDRVDHTAEREPGRALTIHGASPGQGTAAVGGRRLRARWRVEAWRGAEEGADARDGVALARAELRFPLALRGRRPGDRIRTRAGTRSLKRLFGDLRVPRSARESVPVLVDAAGRVLWAAGVAQAAHTLPRAGEDALILHIETECQTPS